MNAVSFSNGVNKTFTPSNIQKAVANTRCLNNELKNDTISFTGKKKAEGEGKKKSSFVHKVLVATVGAPYPGLGQALNGQWGKAALFAFGTPALALGAFMVNPLLGIAVGTAGYIGAFIDAYRNA